MYLLLSRVNIWLICASLFLFGEWYSIKSFTLVNTLLCLSSLWCIMSGGSILNNFFDKDLDTNAGKSMVLNFIFLSPKKSFYLSVILSFIGCLLLIFVNLFSFLIGLVLVVVCLSYSTPPIRTKNIFILDIIWNGIGGGTLPFLLGCSSANSLFSVNTFLYGAIFGFLLASYYLFNELTDVKTDNQYGAKTSTTKLGIKCTIFVAIILYFFSFIISYIFFGLREFITIFLLIAGIPILFTAFVFKRNFRFAILLVLFSAILFLIGVIPGYLFIQSYSFIPIGILILGIFHHLLAIIVKPDFYLPSDL
jgi:4-hydroxybenzoate polyprenyltransferase